MSLPNFADTEKLPLRVHLAGFDRRSAAAIELLFSGPGHGAFIVDDEKSGEGSVAAVIVDLDSLDGHSLWNQCRRRFPDRPIIVLSIQNQELEGARYLQKPVRMQELLRALHEIREDAAAAQPNEVVSESVRAYKVTYDREESEVDEQLDTLKGRTGRGISRSVRYAAQEIERSTSESFKGAIPEAPKVDLTDRRQRRQLFFSPGSLLGNRILDTVMIAVDEDKPWEISCWNGRILILPSLRKVITDLSSVRLKQACSLHCSEDPQDPLPFKFSSRRVRADQTKSMLKDYPAQGTEEVRLESFIWEISVWISRGRVPEGTDLDQAVVMRHWPNMTRLLLTPNAFRIAALWAQRPRSPIDTAETLRISLSHVLTFFCACRSIGLIAESQRRTDKLFKPEPIVANRRRGLMQKILDKFMHYRS